MAVRNARAELCTADTVSQLSTIKLPRKMNLLKKLKSNEFALLVAVLSVLVQSFHSYSVFLSVSSLRGTWMGVAQAALFAITFDMAILFYTVRGRKDVVLGASVLMFLMNVYYYWTGDLTAMQTIFGVFLAIVIPMTQYYYAEEIVEETQPDSTDAIINGMENEMSILRGIIREGKKENERFIDDLNTAEVNARTWKQKHDAMFAELQDTTKEYKDATEKFRRHNSTQTEQLGRLTAELRQLQGATINPVAEAAELEDRTLMGVAKSSPGKIVDTTAPL